MARRLDFLLDLKEQFGPLRPGYYGFGLKLGGDSKSQSQEKPVVFFVLVKQ